MGVEDFQLELKSLRESFEMGLIPNQDAFEKMCIDNQRRNLATLGSSSTDSQQPLNRLALQRLLFPVLVTVSALLLFMMLVVGALYESLSSEIMAQKNPSTARIGNTTSSSDDTASISLRPLYYLSTNEGVLSHLLQIQSLWSITHHLNRSLTPVSFHSSSHFPDVEWINV